MIVDLTQDIEDDKPISEMDNQSDSDYQMALMLSQQEVNITNKEEQIRIDREKADYEMALKLTQEENLNFFPLDECEDKVELATNTSLREFSSTSTPETSKVRKKSCKKRKIENDTSSSCSNIEGSRRKKYIPKPGSGGYAILIALFYNESSPSYKGYLTKDELIDAAQPFANASMRFSQPGDKFTYCGYSSSSILEKKELITKSKKPVEIRFVNEYL